MKPSFVRLSPWILTAVLGALAPAWAEGFRLEKQLALAPGGHLTLRSEAGSVEVVGEQGGGDSVLVRITSSRSDFAEIFDVRIDDSRSDRIELIVQRRSRGLLGSFSGFRGSAEISVSLPAGASAEIDSSGGSVDVSSLAGAVRVDSSGGSVRLSQVGGSATVESSGGSVELEEIGGDIDASSSGGGVRIYEAHGAVVAGSSGGPVKVGLAAGNGNRVRLNSSGGGVEVRLDPSLGFEVDASSSGGDVECDLPVTIRGRSRRESLQGTIGGGGALLQLRSSGGGIRILER